MAESIQSEYEVVIVGGGPVGLCLGLGLARAGRRVLVLEKNADTAEHSRAPAIWPRTQEVLAGLGVLDRFLETGIVAPVLRLWDVDRDRPLLRLPIEELAARTAYPHLLIHPQSRTERVVRAALEAEPTAEVRFSCPVTEVSPSSTQVSVRFEQGRESACVTAAFVAGCDGAHSTVRERIGVSFDGITYAAQAALADVRVEGQASLPFPRLTTRPRLAIGIRMDNALWRLILPFARDDPTPLETRVDDAVSGLFGKVDCDPVWQSEFRLHRRLSSKFSEGRVVLAGDAAHLNSPVGGQGMNAGIQDTEGLCIVLSEALDANDPARVAQYAAQRRRAIASGVNRFTDLLTRLLLSCRGRHLRVVFRLASLLTAVPPIRRILLTRIAMLDHDAR